MTADAPFYAGPRHNQSGNGAHKKTRTQRRVLVFPLPPQVPDLQSSFPCSCTQTKITANIHSTINSAYIVAIQMLQVVARANFSHGPIPSTPGSFAAKRLCIARGHQKTAPRATSNVLKRTSGENTNFPARCTTLLNFRSLSIAFRVSSSILHVFELATISPNCSKRYLAKHKLKLKFQSSNRRVDFKWELPWHLTM